MVVDAHCHFLPPELVEELRGGVDPSVSVEDRGEGGTWLVHARGVRFPLTPLFTDPGAKLERMDRDGIDVALLSAAAPLFFYDLDPSETARLSALFNDAVARLADGSGGRLRGMATVPLNDPETAAAELRRATGELGLRGVEIGTSIGTTMLDDPGLEVFFAAAEELGTPVFLHPYVSMLGDNKAAGLDRFFINNSAGNLLETHVAASRLILGGVLDRHPRLVVHLAHGGGSLPYQIARLDRTYTLREEVRAVAQRRPLEYLGQLRFDTVLYHERPLEFLIGFVGAERVMFGTDYPFDMADLTGLTLRRSADAGTADRVLSGSAQETYGL